MINDIKIWFRWKRFLLKNRYLELTYKKRTKKNTKRLLKKGVVRTPAYGHLAFSLPRFREFVLRSCDLDF